jgi:GW (Gly-Tryp) dipeptide domain
MSGVLTLLCSATAIGEKVASATIEVVMATTNRTLAAPSKVGVGEQYTITASGYTPDRYVELKVNGQTFGWPKIAANGIATFTNATWETGTFTIEARQDGTGPTVSTSINVGQPSTTIPGSTIPGSTVPGSTVPGDRSVSAPNRVGIGEQYTITASGFTPDRYIELKVNGQTFGWPKVGANGTATFTNGTWETGTLTIEARQDGTGPTVSTSINVGQPPTTIPGSTIPGSSVPPTTVTSNRSLSAPITVGIGEQFTITASGFTPGRYVEFLIGTDTFGWGLITANGTASSTNGYWKSGSFTITARQDGQDSATTRLITIGATVTTIPGSTVPPTSVPPTSRPDTTVPTTIDRSLCPSLPLLKSLLGVGLDKGPAYSTTGFPVACVVVSEGSRVEFFVNDVFAGFAVKSTPSDQYRNVVNSPDLKVGVPGLYLFRAVNYWYDNGVEKVYSVTQTYQAS